MYSHRYLIGLLFKLTWLSENRSVSSSIMIGGRTEMMISVSPRRWPRDSSWQLHQSLGLSLTLGGKTVDNPVWCLYLLVAALSALYACLLRLCSYYYPRFTDEQTQHRGWGALLMLIQLLRVEPGAEGGQCGCRDCACSPWRRLPTRTSRDGDSVPSVRSVLEP